MSLWIEALNRRLERDWLADALRSADRAGQAASFLEFFERQRQRSPRDVRWAVAVREIKRHADDLEGAIAMAKTAVGVRPERESLWREAVDLMVRAGRLREAADYLEGWNAPRRADESVAGWRSDLYARAGDADRALAVERDGPRRVRARGDAGRRPQPRAGGASRAGRSPSPGVRPSPPRLAAPRPGRRSRQDRRQRALRDRAGRAGAGDRFVPAAAPLPRRRRRRIRATAGRVLAERGRPEQREEALAWVMRQLFPGGAGAPGSDEALRRWWPFVGAASLEPSVRRDLAARWIARTPGPWQAAATATFTESVGRQMVATVSRAEWRHAVLVLQRAHPRRALGA